LRVIGVDFDVKFTNELAERDLEGKCGLTDFGAARLLIRDSLAIGQQRNTLLHEILHALAEAVLPSKRPLTEEQVEALARGLLAVLRENPDLVRFIVGEET
jgi:hypothetical protein